MIYGLEHVWLLLSVLLKAEFFLLAFNLSKLIMKLLCLVPAFIIISYKPAHGLEFTKSKVLVGRSGLNR